MPSRLHVLRFLSLVLMLGSIRAHLPGAEADKDAADIDAEVSRLEQNRAATYAFCLDLLLQKKDYARAAELATRAVAIPPASSNDVGRLKDSVRDVAFGLLRVEKAPEKAAALCKKALDKLGDDAILHYIASLAYEELGDKEKQDQSLEKAKAAGDGDQALWFNVGSYFEKKRELKVSLEAFKRAAAFSPDKPTHYNADSEAHLAVLHCRLGDYDAAFRHCENLREIAKKIVVSRTSVGWLTAMVYAGKGRELEIEEKYEEAIENYKKSAEVSPGPGGAYHAIGETYLKLKRYEEAQKWFKMARDAGLAVAHVGLGDVHKALGNLEEAQKEYATCEKAFAEEIDKSPDTASNYNNLAWFYATHDRELDKGVELVKKALELAPESPEYLDTLAELYYRKGDRESAVREIKNAIALNPPHIKYYQKQLDKLQKERPE